MEKDKVISLFTQQQRISVTYPGWSREETDYVVRHISTTNESGFVLYSKLDSETVDKAIENEMAFFRNLKQSFEWKVYDYDQPLDLKERLQNHGFQVGEPEALMILDVEASHSFLEKQDYAKVRLITKADEIDKLMELEEEVWGESHSELGERLKRDLQSKDGDPIFIYAAYEGDRPVSTAWMYLHTNTSFASLWGGSTLPEYRKQGFYTSLLGERVKTAQKEGFRFLTVDASQMSKPILEKHGFQCVAYTYPCMSPK